MDILDMARRWAASKAAVQQAQEEEKRVKAEMLEHPDLASIASLEGTHWLELSDRLRLKIENRNLYKVISDYARVEATLAKHNDSALNMAFKRSHKLDVAVYKKLPPDLSRLVKRHVGDPVAAATQVKLVEVEDK